MSNSSLMRGVAGAEYGSRINSDYGKVATLLEFRRFAAGFIGLNAPLHSLILL
jgi:hypothetical protein